MKLRVLQTIPGVFVLLVWSEEGKFHGKVYFHEKQIEDFFQAIIKGTKPLIDGEEGRKTVEIFTALYRSTRDQKPIKFPLQPENKGDYDGRRDS